MGAEPTKVQGADEAADFVLDLADPVPTAPETGDGSWRLGRAGLRATLAQGHPQTRTAIGLVLAVAAVAGLTEAAGGSRVLLGSVVLSVALLLGIWASTPRLPAPAGVSAAELVLGRLLGSWLTAAALLLPALSVLLWATRSPAAALVTVLLLGVVCAFGSAAGRLAPRRPAALTTGLVLLLVAGPVLVYSAFWPRVAVQESILVRQPRTVSFGAHTDGTTGYDPNICGSRQVDVTDHRTERIWMLLAASPYPTLAEALTAGHDRPDRVSRFDLQEARLGPPWLIDGCNLRGARARRAQQLDEAGPAWPYGLALDLLIGAAAIGVAVRRP